jgi:hypothetical protein
MAFPLAASNKAKPDAGMTSPTGVPIRAGAEWALFALIRMSPSRAVAIAYLPNGSSE